PSSALVLSTPSASATISVETLSVSSVKSGSPFFTCSPDFLCQTETTPLEMDSPTAGIFTGTLIARLHKRKPRQESSLSRTGVLEPSRFRRPKVKRQMRQPLRFCHQMENA